MDLLGATICSGVLEVAAGALLFYVTFTATVVAWSAETSGVMAAHADSISDQVKGPFWNAYNLSLFSGSLLFFGFLLTPQGLLSVFTIYEGIFRAVTAAATGETMGGALVVVPYALLTRLGRRGRRAWEQARARPARPDRVRCLHGRTSDGFLVESDALKPDWQSGLAVEMLGEHYRLTRWRTRGAGRQRVWRYLLRPWPAGEIIRRQRSYQPPPESR